MKSRAKNTDIAKELIKEVITTFPEITFILRIVPLHIRNTLTRFTSIVNNSSNRERERKNELRVPRETLCRGINRLR